MQHSFCLCVCIATFLVFSAAAQDNNPFTHLGDRGETVHHLPPPAGLRNLGDPVTTFAPASNKTTVYSASYGFGKLNDHGGLEIANAQVQPIFWNTDVAMAAGSLGWGTVQAQITAFVATFAANKNWSGSTNDDFEIIQQYGSHAHISNTLPALTPYVDTNSIQSTISDSNIQTYLAGLFATRLTPASNTIYGIFFPAGMQITSGSSSSCTSFCGYHSVFTYTNSANQSFQIKYAVFPFPNCSGCSITGLQAADMLTIVASHEIREAVTDPVDNGKNAWYDLSGYEADDKCAWHNLYQLSRPASNPPNNFWVQPEYSNGLTYSGVKFAGPGCVVPK